MHFVGRRQKFNRLFTTLTIITLSLVSIAFGTITSSANSAVDEAGQTEKSFAAAPFSFLSNALTNFFKENDAAPNALNLQPKQSEKLADLPAFAEFDAWVNSYVSNDFRAAGEEIEVGKSLAIKRQKVLLELMQTNPQAALEKAIPAEIFNRLPSYITEHSEKRISGYGDLTVYIVEETDPVTGENTGSRIDRQVVIGNSQYRAFVYGRRETMTTKLNIPLQGIVIGDAMTVGETPARVIDSAEYAERGINQSMLGENGIAAEIGGKTNYFSNQAEFNSFVNDQIAWESKIGPVRDAENSPQAAAAWTSGAKTVLVIRVDFSDKPGEPLDHYNQPLTVARAQSLINSEVSSFYADNSYNQTSMQATVTSVVRLPQTRAFYAQGANYNVMLTDARAAARAAGFETNNFDLDLVTFSYTASIGWAGIAAIGAKSAMLNGAFYLPETAHELGHNYGLLHANLWRTTDGSPIGAGSNVEYGDCYDNMGACFNGTAARHFNSRYKRILNWLTDANVHTVTTSGVYRIVAQDATSAGGVRTLKINKDANRNYWVEFRQLIPGSAQNGALIRWDYSSRSFQETQVLDMIPATTNVRDEALLIGQSFYDSASNIRITVVGKGNTSPESLDVRVELNSSGGGGTPTPTPTPSCTYSITPASQSFSSAGGTGSVNVTTSSGCGWTASSNQSFVTITSGGSGSGNGTVNYLVTANTGAARSGTMTIAGQTFTVQQSGVTASSYTLIASPSIASPGGQLTVNFTAPAGSSLVDWVGLFKVGTADTQYLDGGYTNGLTSGSFTVPAPAQTGQYEFRYFLDNGYTKVATSNTITVQSATTPTPTPTPTVTPTPTPTCTYSISPASQNFGSSGGAGSVSVTTQSGCNWTTGNSQSFINITSGNGGSGSGTVSFSVAVNNGQARSGTMTIAGQTFTVNQAGGTAPSAVRTAFDYDGDGRADASVFRPSNGIWYLLNSQTGFTGLQFGAANDKIVPADYDGDGRTDVAVYRDGAWYLQRSSLGFTSFSFGTASDIPQPADYDGDGRAEIAVFRPTDGTWYVYNLTTNQFNAAQFGNAGDKPVVGDYDGDARADYAVFRPSNGVWYLQRSALGFGGIQFGEASDKPTPADYDGDGKTDTAVFRPSNGTWFVQRSAAGLTAVQFGVAADVPVPADYDGDARADYAIFRNGEWYQMNSSSGFAAFQFGVATDKPVPSSFVP